MMVWLPVHRNPHFQLITLISILGINDCGDNSDEFGCTNVNPTNGTDESTTTIPPVKECSAHQFTCDSGLCISKPQLCDGIRDCPNGEDEKYCPEHRSCGEGSFR